MNEKHKQFQHGEQVFRFARLSPEDGSYWLGVILAIAAEAIQKAVGKASSAEMKKAATQAAKEAEKTPAELAEEMARGYVSAALEAMDRDTFRAIQKDALGVAYLMVGDAPIRLKSDDGRWAFSEIAEDYGLIRKLTNEALTFNLTDFFERNLSR